MLIIEKYILQVMKFSTPNYPQTTRPHPGKPMTETEEETIAGKK